MGNIPFTVSARTARLIGQENFSNPQGAIIELVKNSYDADAHTVILVFDGYSDGKYDNLYIIDNGEGMSESTILNKWMRIGTDNKELNYLSGSGRIKSGAKGIGRFALDRLGRSVVMYTKEAPSNEGLMWSVDWELFDSSNSISDVTASLETIQNFNLQSFLNDSFKNDSEILKIVDQSFGKGTILKISGLRDDWDYTMNTLFQDLEVLTPPSEQPAVNLFLFTTNNPGEYGKIGGDPYSDFDYKVNIVYTANENKDLIVDIIRNELDTDRLSTEYKDVFQVEDMIKANIKQENFKHDHHTKSIYDLRGFSKISPDLIEKLGSFEFTFYFIKNTIGNEEDSNKYPYRSFIRNTRLDWLKKFGGVKIFRDNFRVRPYGDVGNDWLNLGERQARSPAGAGQNLGGYRIRPNQVAGTIKLSRNINSYLADKSSREGIIENEVFELFKNTILEFIGIFERDRNTIMYSLDQLDNMRNPAEKVKKQAKEIANKHKRDGGNNSKGGKKTDEEILSEGIDILSEELKRKAEEASILRSLASTGLIMGAFAHELRSIQNTLSSRFNNLDTAINRLVPNEQLEKLDKFYNPQYLISILRKDDAKIKDWISYILLTLRRDRRKMKVVGLDIYFRTFQETWHNILLRQNIEMEINIDRNAQNIGFKILESDLDSIFNNLISNSIKHLAGGLEKKITISLSSDDKSIIIDTVDNGAGLSREFQPNPEIVFKPFVTSEVDRTGNVIGTGLGLFIVKSVIDCYENSKVSIIKIDGGFGVRVYFHKN